MPRGLTIDIDTGNLISKAALAKHLGVSAQSIRNYLLLTPLIPEFRGDYPQVNGSPYTRFALTEYQCWVISQISRLSQSYPRPVLIAVISAHPEKLSKEAFNSRSNLTTLVA